MAGCHDGGVFDGTPSRLGLGAGADAGMAGAGTVPVRVDDSTSGDGSQ